ncbi:MAG: enoyl-CoA hydratase-related protein [Pseudomonadota bacterium]|nr:enoyl-CoA hydratase-related protein [Pseudomonadota bacterium]
MTETLLCKTDDRGVTTLSLNRPERRNAFDGHLMVALIAHLEALQQDPASRVLVLTGSGKTFCSGADLAWIETVIEEGEASNEADAAQLASMMQALYAFPKPTIARVNGAAYGGGVGLIACCDIAIASETAEFAFSEVRLGLVAAAIAPYVLAAMGSRNARRLLLSAQAFSSQQAQAMGLVFTSVADAALDEAVEEQLYHLLQGEPNAQLETKRLIQHLVDDDEGILTQTAELSARVRASAGARHRIQAFLKRHKSDRER